MNIFVLVSNEQQLMFCHSSSVRAVIFSTAFCSSKTQHPLTLSELAKLSDLAGSIGMPWYLSINRMMLQSEWTEFQQEIINVNKFDPEGYIVSDLGVMHYLMQIYPGKKIILQTDTTITNVNDVEVLLDLGVDYIALARELTFTEVKEIVEKFGERVIISGFGYQCMSTSNRPLLSNYFDHIHHDFDGIYKRFTLQEEGRIERYPAMQDTHGFHIFTSSVLEIFDEVEELSSIGLKNLMIETVFADDETIQTVIMTFNKKTDIPTAKAEISAKYNLSKALYYTPTSAVKVVGE